MPGEALRSWRGIDSLSAVLREIRKNPEPFRLRVEEFDAVLQTIRGDGELPAGDFFHLTSLRKAIPDQEFSTLPSLAGLVTRNNTRDQRPDAVTHLTTRDAGLYTLREIGRVVTNDPDFYNPKDKDPQVLAGKLLVKGYGLFLENLYPGELNIQELFVLAFGQTVAMTSPDSQLFADIAPDLAYAWEDFPPDVQEQFFPYLSSPQVLATRLIARVEKETELTVQLSPAELEDILRRAAELDHSTVATNKLTINSRPKREIFLSVEYNQSSNQGWTIQGWARHGSGESLTSESGMLKHSEQDQEAFSEYLAHAIEEALRKQAIVTQMAITDDNRLEVNLVKRPPLGSV